MNIKRMISLNFLILIFSFIFLAATASAETKEMTFDTSNYAGGAAIAKALEVQNTNNPYDQLNITLKPGTYNFDEYLVLYSNTKLVANGCTINYTRNKKAEGSNGRNSMISNSAANVKGYGAASNISIEGGTWDFQGKKNQINNNITMEAFRFMHCKNIILKNITFQNLYSSHFITIEGVDGVSIQNCTFKDMTKAKTKKEAIHIDIMHNEAMAPSNEDNIIYDDTECKNVTIDKCNFTNVRRGVGTHIAVAGVYPSNIKITNNTFTNITYEAIKAYHYKNCTINNNKITNAGFGIKYYLYAPESESDNDEEGQGNYMPANKGTSTQALPLDIKTTINNNIVKNINSTTNGFGIHVAGTKNREVKGISIVGNKISNTKNIGIYTDYANNVTMINNQLDLIASDGIMAKDCNSFTMENNTINNTSKHGFFAEKTLNAKINNNIISKDKKGGICIESNCKAAKITNNIINSSGKNAIGVFSSPKARISKNRIKGAKNFGIYINNSKASKVNSNKVNNTKSTGIIVMKASNVTVKANIVKKAGKYGILFGQTKKSNAGKNTIIGAKNYSICYSSNSKNKRLNHRLIGIKCKKNSKVVSGKTTGGLKIRLLVNGKKTSKKKVNKNGKFSIKTKKLKKSTKLSIQLFDSYGNMSEKNIRIK